MKKILFLIMLLIPFMIKAEQMSLDFQTEELYSVSQQNIFYKDGYLFLDSNIDINAITHIPKDTKETTISYYNKNGDCLKTKYIEHCEEGSIYSVSPIKRIIVYFAGPFANYIFTIFCFTLLSCLTSISTVYTSKIRLTTDSSNYSTVVSAAEKAGISSGEIITSIDGNIMNDWSDIQNYLSKFDNKTQL